MTTRTRITVAVVAAIAVGVFSASCQRGGAASDARVSLKDECLKTMLELCDALERLQNGDVESPDFGAIDCPQCGVLHTRASEALYPFAVAFHNTGNEKHLQAAIDTGNWLIRQQQPDGKWFETPNDWTGTTADQLLMMTLAYPILEEHLSPEERATWTTSMRRAADWLYEAMSPDFASINYCPTTAAVMFTTNAVIPDERYIQKARQLARWVVAKMDEAGFITGEAARVYGVKYGVDLGYEMDMSLWGLALYARLADDGLVDAAVRKSLAKNLFFVYPQGMIDASWGARSYKWTTFGSKTADGSQVLFSLYAHEDPRYRTAAIRNLEYLRTMIRGGMVGYGPHFWDLPELGTPCNYPTFARAKNLAMAVELGTQEPGPAPPLPSDEPPWLKLYPTVDLAVARTENLMTTISAYGYKNVSKWDNVGKYLYSPTGGSMCNLWVEGHGLLQTSSQTKYFRGEEMHMPVLDEEILSLTPRIEYEDDLGYFTNLFERDGRLTAREEGGAFIVEAGGELTDENQLPGGVAYVWRHRIADDFVEKSVTVRYHDRNPAIRIVEPIVHNPDMRFELQDDHTVLITGGGREFRFEVLSGNVTIELGRNAEAFWFPFPSIRCYPIVLKLPAVEERYGSGRFTEEVVYRISLL